MTIVLRIGWSWLCSKRPDPQTDSTGFTPRRRACSACALASAHTVSTSAASARRLARKIHPCRRADGSARRQNCRFSVPSPASRQHAFVGPVDSPRLTTRTVDLWRFSRLTPLVRAMHSRLTRKGRLFFLSPAWTRSGFSAGLRAHVTLGGNDVRSHRQAQRLPQRGIW
jgi:hypothetical protein